MQAATHALIGTAAGLLMAAHYNAGPTETFAMATLTAVSALLPDIDHPNSVIRRRLGIAGTVAVGWLRHRGITHSITAIAIIAVAAVALFPARNLSTLVAIGYGSHVVADLITPAGVALFAPVTWKRYKLPLVRTGSLSEWAIRVVLVFLLLWIINWRW